MDFKLVSRKSMGIIISLTLIILLLQSRFFYFLLDTILGRSLLVLFLLFIASTSKILGIFVVLYIIILCNNSNIGYIEGFSTDNSTNVSDTKDDTKRKTTEKIESTKVKVNSTKDISNTSNINKEITSKVLNKTNKNLTTGGAEGFDIIGTETNILRGKPSNQIPVNSQIKDNFNISPFEGSFSQLFYSY
jgi:hypothetical protein